MRRPLALASLALASLGGVGAAQVTLTGVEPGATANGIVANGVGEVRVRPSRAVVYFTVETSAESGVLAASENGVRRTKVLDTLAVMGYPATEVPTYAYAAGPAMDVPMRQPGPTTPRFTSKAGLQVTVSPLARLEDVVHAILWVGDTQIQYVAYEADDQEARARAIEAAVTQAQRDAEAMARAAGGRLGPLLQLTTLPDFVGWNASRAMLLERAISMRGPTLVPSDMAVRVIVQGRWEFRPR